MTCLAFTPLLHFRPIEKLKTTEDYPLHLNILKGIEGFPFEFGNYVLDSIISNGNSVVFKALQKEPERLVALKIPKLGILDSKYARDRFRTEYAFAAGLRHPAIVPVLEVGQWEGVPYYTMPYVDGHSLIDHVLLRKTPLKEKIKLFERICEIVLSLHEVGLIHRDLKSENIMIDEFGEVALLDFGLAHIVSDEIASEVEGSVTGTIRYMSPEQASGIPAAKLGFQTDIFALGVIGFRLFSGVFPIELPENKILALQSVKDCEIDFAPINEVPISRSLKNALKKSLSKNASQRPENAGELLLMMGRKEFAAKSPKHQNSNKNYTTLLFLTAGIAFSVWGGLSLLLG